MNHPPKKPQILRTPKIAFSFEGQKVEGHEGETIAAALMRTGELHLRNGLPGGAPRGVFCGMGICQECVVLVAGIRREACRTLVAAGISVMRG